MRDQDKTKDQLIGELGELRQRIAELEAAEADRQQAEEALRESEEIAKALLEAPTDLVSLTDVNGVILSANAAMSQRFGMPKDGSIGLCGWDLLPSDLVQSRKAYFDQVIQSGEPCRFEDERQGIWFDNVFYPVFDAQGEVSKIAIIARDITGHKQTEDALRVKDNAIASSINGIAIAEFAGSLTYVNGSFLKMWGYDDENEILGRPAVDFWQMEEQAWEVIEALHDRDGWTGELVAQRKDGSLFDVQLSASRITDETGEPVLMLASFLDITDRKRAEEQLRASVREKEVMLGEIHHRVRNNLQIMSALLDLQAHNVQDRQAREALVEARTRVHSMALVHEQLYCAPDLGQIDFAAYVQNLTSHLLKACQIVPGRIAIDLDVDDVSLQVNQAIPCGMIINELVTNALKHAFPVGEGRDNSAEEEPRISIVFQSIAEEKYRLLISDNGVGLPTDFQFPTRETIGMLLIGAYARELNATVEWDGEGGTTCRLMFGG